MITRPLSLTIIAWLMIIRSGLGLTGFLFMANTPELLAKMGQSMLPVWFQSSFTVISMFAFAAVGLGILKGENWARWLCISWAPLALLVSFLATLSVGMFALQFAVFVVVVKILFRNRANHWFNPNAAAAW